MTGFGIKTALFPVRPLKNDTRFPEILSNSTNQMMTLKLPKCFPFCVHYASNYSNTGLTNGVSLGVELSVCQSITDGGGGGGLKKKNVIIFEVLKLHNSSLRCTQTFH